MPSESIWLQFTVVAILILAAGVIWREVKKFVDEQDKKREDERERQRIWQEKQDKLRDERWQQFLQSMQDQWIKQDGRNNQTIKDLIVRMEDLIEKIDDHDKFTREAISAMRERTSK
jgi:Flp pilus assembly protein TadB